MNSDSTGYFDSDLSSSNCEFGFYPECSPQFARTQPIKRMTMPIPPRTHTKSYDVSAGYTAVPLSSEAHYM